MAKETLNLPKETLKLPRGETAAAEGLLSRRLRW